MTAARFTTEPVEDGLFVIRDGQTGNLVLDVPLMSNGAEQAPEPLALRDGSAKRLAGYLDRTLGRTRRFCPNVAAARFRADRTAALGKLPAAPQEPAE